LFTASSTRFLWLRRKRAMSWSAGGLLGLEAAGVDDDELAPAELGVAVVAVARQAGEVGDDGVAALRDAVEERALADVGAADQGDDGLHAAGGARGTGARAGPAALNRAGTRTRRRAAS
jgi:hypothetical protein